MSETVKTIATEITRIQKDRNDIRTKLVELGMAQSTDNLDTLAAAIGEIENNGSVSANVKEGETFTIPKGYHDGSGTVSGVKGGGNYTTQSKTVTPTKKQQAITPDQGYYALSDVTVDPIPEAYQVVTDVTAGAADVLTGKKIVDKTGAVIAGTMANNGAVAKTLTADAPSYTVPAGYHDGKGVVKIVPEAKTVTPSKTKQTVKPTTGNVLSSVTVDVIPAKYQDVTEVTAADTDVLSGKKIVSADGTVVTGAMPNNGALALTIDGMTATSAAIPAGYTSGGTVTLTSSILEALAAI